MTCIKFKLIWKALESLPKPVQFIFHKSLEQRCVVQIGITCGATKSSNLVRTTKVKEELYFGSKIWEYSSVLRLSCPSVCTCVVEILRRGKQQLQDQPVQNRAGMDGRYDVNKHEEEHGWMGVAAFRCSNGSRLKQVKQDSLQDWKTGCSGRYRLNHQFMWASTEISWYHRNVTELNLVNRMNTVLDFMKNKKGQTIKEGLGFILGLVS